MKEARLDEVYFLVEAIPRRKEGVTHIAHRLAMAKLATSPYPKLHILELPEKQFSVAKTLPRLKQRFAEDKLFFICGSDMIDHMPEWNLIDRMLAELRLVVALRDSESQDSLKPKLSKLSIQSQTTVIIDSPSSDVSSKKIRIALRQNKKAKGLLPSTVKYIKQHWLYSAVSDAL